MSRFISHDETTDENGVVWVTEHWDNFDQVFVKPDGYTEPINPPDESEVGTDGIN